MDCTARTFAKVIAAHQLYKWDEQFKTKSTDEVCPGPGRRVGMASFWSRNCVLAAAVPSFVRIDRHDKSISNKTLKYRPGYPVLLFSL
jgi:hypothetical protein